MAATRRGECWRRLIALIMMVLLVPVVIAETRRDADDPNVAALQLWTDDLARAMAAATSLVANDQRELDLLLHDPADADQVRRGPPPADGCGVFTPRFGAALAWCRAWGLPLATVTPKVQAALFHVLEKALSPGGYQTVLAIMNRQRLLAEQEDFAKPTSETWINDIDAQYNSTNQLVDLADVTLYTNVSHRLIGGTFTSNTSSFEDNRLQWQWGGAGLDGRVKQWEDYALALFASSPSFDDGDIGLRFEGHHVSVNIFVKRDGTKYEGVHATPLFLGAAPMLVTPVPDDTMTYASSTWLWKQGQTLLTNLAAAVREFLLALPAEKSEAAIIPVAELLAADGISTVPPMNLASPPSWMVVSLTKEAPNSTLFFASHPSMTLQRSDLSIVAQYRLGQLLSAFADIHDNKIAAGLRASFANTTEITLSFSGGALDDPWSPQWLLVQASPPKASGDDDDTLLVEYLQTEQFQVSEDGVMANHVHAMVRRKGDDDVMHAHHAASHHNQG